MGMRSYTGSVSIKKTPQSQKILGSKQILNNAGGYVFQVNDWTRLTRFLVLGTEGGTYYVNEKSITLDNAEVVLRCLKKDGLRTVSEIVKVSHAGRAPKNDAAIFALAMATVFGDDKFTRVAAFNAVPQVCRIGTHLYSFTEARKALGGGWGRSMKGAIGRWYTSMNDEKLAYQLVKYRQRNGWSARDLLRLSHPKPLTPTQSNIFNWVVSQEFKKHTEYPYPKTLEGFRTLLTCTSAKEAIPVIEKYDLPREAVESVNTEFLKDPGVWEALLGTMPLEATIRNLGVMSARGLIRGLSPATRLIIKRLSDAEYLHKSRIHPFKVLVAMKTYQGGVSRGGVAWTPIQQIVDALDTAFYESFQNIESTGKRFLIGVDISGSMSYSATSLSDNLTCAEAAAAMAMVIARTEKDYMVMGFATSFVDLKISPRQRLDDIVKRTAALTMGGTDCALPMIYTKKNNLDVDAHIVITDNETWAGNIHPVQALKQYRQHSGINSKLVVVGMTATEFSIADSNDSGMLDVVGLDTATPQIITDFVGERF